MDYYDGILLCFTMFNSHITSCFVELFPNFDAVQCWFKDFGLDGLHSGIHIPLSHYKPSRGNKNGLPSMKVKKLENFKDKMGLNGPV